MRTSSAGSSVDDNDGSSLLQSLQDESTVDSDSEDVSSESYEVFLMMIMTLLRYFKCSFPCSTY